MTPSKQLAAARLAACRKMPYLSTALLTMQPVERPGLGTLAVDAKWRLYFDPAFLDSIPPDQLVGVVLHEVAHLVLKHHRRAKGIAAPDQMKLWNVAADLAVNSMLREQGVALPPDGMFPEQFKVEAGLTAEAYFRLLLDQQEKQQQGQQGEQGSQGDPSQGDGEPGDKPKPGEGGSCSDGVPRPWELGDDADDAADAEAGDQKPEQGQGQGKPSGSQDGPPGLEEYEEAQVLDDVAKKIEQAGNAPGQMKRAASDILHPKVDPRRLLMRALQRHTATLTAGNGRFSYRRPARRPGQGGTIRPRSFAPVPNILVLIDTSGSMESRDLALCVGLVAKCLNSLHMRDGIHVIAGDTMAQSEMKVFDPSKIELAGGGGTDMGELIVHASQSKERPGLIVCCTDGITPWPSAPVGIPVVACLTRPPEKGGYYQVPEWIETVVMSD